MKVLIERPKKEMELEFEGTAKDLMKKLNVNPEVVIVVKNGEVVTEEAELSDSDEIKLVSVVSGG